MKVNWPQFYDWEAIMEQKKRTIDIGPKAHLFVLCHNFVHYYAFFSFKCLLKIYARECF